MSRFTRILLVSPLDDGDTWVLMRDFGYEVGREGSADIVDVQLGFMTDFASVPWLFQGLIPKWGKYGNAAVIHDWLYWSQGRPRKAADLVLLEAMEVMGVDSLRKYAIYYGVRAFGWWAWLRNREDRVSGFERVSRQLDLKSGVRSLRRGSLPQVFNAVIRRAGLKRAA